MNTNGSSKGVAIIGMACRFPGANNIATFWENVCRGVESITHFSREDLLREGVDAALLDDPSYVRASPILEGFDLFDAAFFEYSPREAQFMEPQQRLLHEVAWEAFEDAGYHPETAEGPTGVFASAGGVVTSYLVAHQRRHSSLPGATGSMQHIGNDKDFLSTRLSYKLNLTGPSLNIQTACSSSLVALHQACRSLASGECRMALVGAANVRMPHKSGYLYNRGDILSPDGHCRAFDAKAEGTVFGSGVAAVLLKEVDDAKADRDQIYAIIKGTAVNNDGAQKVSYTASSVPAQSRAMVEALALSGLPPETISYVECHGTGTIVGDPLEVHALNRAFRAFTDRIGFCAIGSVKTNIGHLEQAAGLAGLIKVALAIRKAQIPPSLNFQSPNPKIAFGESPFFVSTRLSGWEGIGGCRRAAVNALGLGGTNAFAVLEAGPSEAPLKTAVAEPPMQLLCLSSKDDAALAELASRLKERLASDSELDLADVCFTAGESRSQMPVRLAVSARTREQMAEQLRPFTEGGSRPGLVRRTGKRKPLAFLFTGQGSQYSGMSAELYRMLPQFRRTLDRCDELFRPLLERPLLDVIFALDAGGGLLNETVYTQTALFAVEYALAELWQSLGVAPDVVMGHSIGEFVAACVAGVMSLEDASKLVAARGRLMQGLPPGGSMASILADEETTARLIATFRAPLSIAAVNAPQSVVVSGKAAAIRKFLKSLKTEGIIGKQLVVSHAFHSALMEPILDQLELIAQDIEFKAPAIPMVANLTGLVTDEPLTGLYWKRHARGVVQFAKGMETLSGLGCATFLEIGPGNTLLGLGRRSVPQVDGLWLASLSRHRDEREQFLESLGRLFVSGYAINWKAIESPYPQQRVSLPTYPFQRQSYLLEDNAPEAPMPAKVTPTASHPLLGARLRSGLKEVQFEATYRLAHFPFLGDHRIYGLPVLPLTAGLEAAIAGGMGLLASREIELKNFVYHEALLVPEEGFRIVHTIFTPQEGPFEFQILSTGASDLSPWSSHISATLCLRSPTPDPDKCLNIQDLIARQIQEIPVDRYYRTIAELGLNYGPSFRGIQALWRGEGEAVSRVRIPDSLAIESFELHPAFLDACLHVYPALVKEYADFTALPEELGRTFLPIGLERVRFLDRGLREGWVHAVRRPASEGNRDTMTLDLRILNSAGRAVAILDGLLLKRLGPEDLRASRADAIENWLYQTTWVPRAPLAPASSRKDSPSRWIVFADQHGVALELVRRLESLAQECQLIYPDLSREGNAQEKIIDAVVDTALVPGHDYRGVVYLWGLDEGQISVVTPESLAGFERLVLGGALALIRALSRAGQRSPQMPRLWLVTRNSQAATSGSPPIEPLPAILWGLGRTAASEHPKFWGGLVDLAAPGGTPEVQAEELLRELWNPDKEKQVAIRPTGRMVARLMRLPRGAEHQAPLFREDASYLISGGLGSLGLRVAGWMAARGARRMVLTSRRAPQAQAAETVRAFEAKGIRTVVAIGDITKEADVDRILGEIRATMSPLRGVFHCAGMLADGILDQMDWSRFSAVTAPKITGSWLLHRATLNDELDHFVLFSSILSLMGSPGQSNYTAANAFLDALTEHRRAAGLPAVTLNWGPWAGTGLATNSGARGEAIWKSRGTRYIPPDLGIQVLEHILRRGVGHAAVTITDWREFLQQFPAPVPFYEELAKTAGPKSKRPKAGHAPSVTHALIDAAQGGERRKLIIQLVAQEAAGLLGGGVSIDPGRPLGELGLDSLMSVSLVNRLEPALGVLVPMASLLKGPSVEELVDSIFPGLKDLSPPEVEFQASTAGIGVQVNRRSPGGSLPQSEWIVVTRPNPAATVRLFCFPFAGGGSAVYRLWDERIGQSIEIIAVEPPGRLARIDQAPVSDVHVFAVQAAEAMTPLLDKPFALFGHCLGGLTMYETARQLQRTSGKLPIHMFVSGSRPPDLIDQQGPFERLLQDQLLWNRLYDPFLPIHEQPEEVFIDVIRLFHIDSTEQMLKSPELRALVLPIVRAEFEMASKYRYRQEEPWNFPITCFKGENDLYVTRTDILSWSRFTTSSFQVHIRQGEHFLLVDDRDFLMRAINRDLADYSPRASVATIGLPGVNQLAEWRPNSDSHGKPQLTNEPTAQPV
jgi:acyl transferase domain-containing protein/surfactin synthase thioesterase subunit/acyl carrier protein